MVARQTGVEKRYRRMRMDDLGLLTPTQRQELELLMRKDNHVLQHFSVNQHLMAVRFIEWWANMRLNSGIPNIVSASLTQSVVYDYYLEQFLPGQGNQEQREELKDL